MLHDIGVDLGAQLVKKKCPIPVVDGPEPTGTASWSRERIVIQHDDGDTFGPPLGQHRVSKSQRMTRAVAAKLLIYSQSPAVGSLPWEHRQRAEHVLDLVLVGLETVAIARKNRWTPKSGRFFTPPDLQLSEVDGGAAYELTFSFDRAVDVQNWDGSTQPEVSLGNGGVLVSSTDKITLHNGPAGQTPETAC